MDTGLSLGWPNCFHGKEWSPGLVVVDSDAGRKAAGWRNPGNGRIGEEPFGYHGSRKRRAGVHGEHQEQTGKKPHQIAHGIFHSSEDFIALLSIFIDLGRLTNETSHRRSIPSC